LIIVIRFTTGDQGERSPQSGQFEDTKDVFIHNFMLANCLYQMRFSPQDLHSAMGCSPHAIGDQTEDGMREIPHPATLTDDYGWKNI
jgi:hypothetical protein